ncbi:MAG: amino acid adenylation domain-containing protein [Williamsia sp.]|nr:amino acid adenylation domain-containing protein [Williamsia sp.]
MHKATFPLHPAQVDVYTDQLIHSASPHYNIGGYIRIQGSLNKELFYQTVDTLPLVFDVYKMRFNFSSTEPVCFFDDQYSQLQVHEFDLTHHEDPQAEALQWMQNRFNTPFHIEEENPLFEHCLIKLACEEHWFFCRYHHLITDGYGFIVFVQYLARKYKSLTDKDGFQFSHPSYLEEAKKAVEQKESAASGPDREYWLEKISETPQRFLLSRYKVAAGGKESAIHLLDLDDHDRALLGDIQNITKCSLQQLTIAALLIYFGKTAGQAEFVFGIPIHRRSSRQMRNVMGMFSGILPYKAIFNKDVKVHELLLGIASSQKNDYRHQNFSLGEISRALKLHSSEEYLCDIIINYELLDFEAAFDDNIQAAIVQLTSEYQRNPLQISWRDYGRQQPLQLHTNFRRDYFTSEEISLLSKRILFIIKQIPSKLSEPIGNLDHIPPPERALVQRFNHPSVEYPGSKSLVTLFEEQVLRTPRSLAVKFEGNRLSYQELNERSNQLARRLVSVGVKEEMLVPLCTQRSFDMIVGMLGIMKAGGAYVPIDPQYPQERINYFLEDTSAAVVVCDKENRTRFQDQRYYTLVEVSGNTLFTEEKYLDNLYTRIRPGQLAYVIYTSGSTGRPKGVMIEHAGVVNLIKTQTDYFKITSSDRILQFSNFCFDASVEQIFLALLNGASLIVLSEEVLLNTNLFTDLLNREQISHLHATPLFLETLPAVHNGYLKRVIAGGDLCKKPLSERWKGLVEFYNEYGPTETTVTAVEYSLDNNQSSSLSSVPIGKPVINTQVYILDKAGEICPIGVPGELFIGGIQVGRGYLNLSQLTADSFLTDHFTKEPGRRLYKTGDLARWLEDGNIEYLGRIDDQVKIRGYRVELGEIENVLLKNRSVKEAVVLAKDDSEGNKQLIGYIVPVSSFNREEIESYLRSQLPAYMIPAWWITLEGLPLTSSGKINRKALPDPAYSVILDNRHDAPLSEVEIQVADIWREVLNIEIVGIHSNFFELGGHSLQAIKLISRLYKKFNIQVNIKSFFSNPTIKELCRIISNDYAHQFTGIMRLPEQDFYELSHAQKRIWVLSHLKGGSLAYSVPSVYVLEGPLQVSKLRQAFDGLLERHEILRTVFVEIKGEARQRILQSDAVGFTLEESDLRNDPAANKTIQNAIANESKRPFDLENGPLLRAMLFQIAIDKHVIIFNIHHIICDGWSKGIIIKEILQLYKQWDAEGKSKFSVLPIQYKDYAAWHAGSLSTQGNYWRKLFEKGIPVLQFPLDFERPAIMSFAGSRLQAKLSDPLSLDLRRIATRHNMTVNNLLLSLYGILLACHSRQKELVIGSLTSGRNHIDLENLIGVFINFLPIKLSLNEHMKLSDYLKESNDRLLEAYDHQDYPFDLIVNDCVQQRDVSRNPIFDTMVNFHSENSLIPDGQPSGEQFYKNGLALKPYQLREEDFFHSTLDFMMDIEPVDDHFVIYLSYNSQLFTRDRMRGFLNGFVELLERVAAEPDRSLHDYCSVAELEPGKLPGQQTEGLNKPGFPVMICSSFVAEPVNDFISYWIAAFKLNANLRFAPYNQLFQELLNPDSGLNRNKGMNILFIRVEDWLRDQKDKSAFEQADLLELTYREFLHALEYARTITSASYLIGIVPLSSFHSFAGEIRDQLTEINSELESYIKALAGFSLLDMNEVARLYSVDEIFDPVTDREGHIPFTQEYYAALGTFLSRQIRAYTGNQYKVIALDCDNTLWRGVCGEVGPLGVAISSNFTYFHQFLLGKYKEGFLLVLCSKNNEEDVRQVFEQRPEMILKWEHIAGHRLNWRPKHENLADITKELNISLDSIVFFDDNDFEIEQMQGFCPQVLSLVLPDDLNSLPDFLNHIWELDRFHHTQEDLLRNQMYKAEKLRKHEQAKYSLLSDFLQSLNIQTNLRPLCINDLPRAVQLSQRTNQFNLNGIQRTKEDMAALINDQHTLNWIIEVKDRFGDYGIVGLVLARQTRQVLSIESFMLSCRVLGRNVEDFVLSRLQNHCILHALNNIEAEFKDTGKNRPFSEFLSRTNWKMHPGSNVYYFYRV